MRSAGEAEGMAEGAVLAGNRLGGCVDVLTEISGHGDAGLEHDVFHDLRRGEAHQGVHIADIGGGQCRCGAMLRRVRRRISRRRRRRRGGGFRRLRNGRNWGSGTRWDCAGWDCAGHNGSILR